MLQGPQGPPGGVGPMGAVGEKVFEGFTFFFPPIIEVGEGQ